MPDQNSRSNTGERMRRAREQRLKESPETKPALNLSRPYSLYGSGSPAKDKPAGRVRPQPVREAEPPRTAHRRTQAAKRAPDELDVFPLGRTADAEEEALIRIVKRDERKLEKLKKAEDREQIRRRSAVEREKAKARREAEKAEKAELKDRERAERAEELENRKAAKDEAELERAAVRESRETLRLEKKQQAAQAAEEKRAEKEAGRLERAAAKEAEREERAAQREAAKERAAKLREKKREERRAWLADETVKKRIRLLSWAGGLILLLGGAVLFLMLYANVKSITVVGCEKYPAEQVINLSGLYTGRNLFLYDLGEAKRAVSSDPYLDCIGIRRIFPDRLEIAVKERSEFMAIRSSSGRYTVADREGFVLAVGRSDGLDGLLPVYGLDSVGFTTGTRVDADRSALRPYTLMEIVGALGERSGEIKYLDISNSASIKLVTVSGVTLMLGDAADAPEKTARAFAILDSMDKARLDGAVVYVLSGGRADIAYPTEKPAETQDPDATQDPDETQDPDAAQDPDETQDPDAAGNGGGADTGGDGE